jgi:hypothetical protein
MSTCSGSDHGTSLTTTSTTPVMPENRGGGNKNHERLAQLGLQNPYDNFRGRLGPLMHARSMLTKSGDVSFYSRSTTDVTQRALRESSEDPNGERENNALSKALQTKEQRGRVRGVSSKMIWKEGFLEHKSMYQKRKMTLTPQVDVEELKR